MVALLCCGALTAQPVQPTVATVTVRNNYFLSRQEVLDTLGVAEGMALDHQKLEAAVTRWNRAGDLGTIAYRIEPAEAGAVELILDVAERTTLIGVEFRGNDDFSADKLLELSGLEVGGSVGRADVAAAERNIVAAYHRAGYSLAATRGVLEPARIAEPNLVIHVVEGRRVWIEEIEFGGRRQVEERELRRVLQSKTRGFIAWIWPGWFNEETFQEDIQRLQSTYHALGYLDAEVGGTVSYGEDQSRATLQFAIYEGELYDVTEIAVEGNTLFKDEELLSVVPLTVGRAFKPLALEEGLEEISALYAAQGYMDVSGRKGNLYAQPAFAAEGTDVSVRITVVEGEPVYIRRIEIHGLTKTKESVVRRQLTFYPSDRANSVKLKESEARLINTGYFDRQSARPVQITLEPDEGALRDAIVRVKEGPTGRFMLGAGLGSESGVIGEISLVEENFNVWNWPADWNDMVRGNAFRGGGQRLAIMLRLGTERTLFAISLDDPSLFDTEYSGGASIYSRGIVRNQFDETRTGFRITGGQRPHKFLEHSVTVGYENVKVDEVAFGAPADVMRDAGDHAKPFVRFDIATDRLDNRFKPSEGYTAGGGIELAAIDVQTIGLRAQGKRYWTVGENAGEGKRVVGVRGRAAIVSAYSGDVPVFERLYAGGFSTLRGFEFEGVSPIDPLTGEQVGGEAMLVGSAEYSFPLTEDDNVRLVSFVDAGYVGEDALDILTGWDELRLSLGIGVRFQIPFMGSSSVELDVAVPVLKEDGDDTQNFHFSVGAERRF